MNLDEAKNAYDEAQAASLAVAEQQRTVLATIDSLNAEITGLDPASSDKEFARLTSARDAAEGRYQALEARSVAAQKRVAEATAALHKLEAAASRERLAALRVAVEAAAEAIFARVSGIKQHLIADLEAYEKAAAAHNHEAGLHRAGPPVPRRWEEVSPDGGEYGWRKMLDRALQATDRESSRRQLTSPRVS